MSPLPTRSSRVVRVVADEEGPDANARKDNDGAQDRDNAAKVVS